MRLFMAPAEWKPISFVMHDQVRRFATDSTRADSPADFSVFKDPQRSAYKWKRKSELPQTVIDCVLRVASGSLPGQLYADAVREQVVSA